MSLRSVGRRACATKPMVASASMAGMEWMLSSEMRCVGEGERRLPVCVCVCVCMYMLTYV